MALQRTRVAHTEDQYVVIDLGDPIRQDGGTLEYVDDGSGNIVFEGGDMSPEAKAKCMFESFTRNEQAAAALRAPQKGSK